MLYRIFLFVVFLVLYTSCTNFEEEAAEISIEIDENLSDKPFLFSSLFDDFTVIPLETNSENLFGNIDDLIITDENIFVFDGKYYKGVLIFQRDGKYITGINAHGRGPGEFSQVPDFDINYIEKEIIILDWAMGKLCIYDFDGKHKRDVRLSGRYSDVSYKKPFFYLGNSSGDGPALSIADESGKILKTTLNNQEVFRTNFLYLRPMGNFYNSNNYITLNYPYDPIIFKVDNKLVKPYIELVSESFQKKSTRNKENVEEISVIDVTKLNSINSFSENKKFAYFNIKSDSKHYYTFYFFNTKKTICTSKIEDDVTFVQPRLLQLQNNMMIAYLDSYMLLEIGEQLQKADLNIPKILENEILKQSLSHSYPILILYNVKD